MRRIKMYYIPGLISLIGLPILLLFFSPEDPVKYTVLRHFLPSDDQSSRFSMYAFYKSMENKRVSNIELPHSKLNNVQIEIKQFLAVHDTNTVLQIVLNNNSTYGDFVWVINEAVRYDLRRYVFTDNSIYIFARPPAASVAVEFDPVSIGSGPFSERVTSLDLFKWRMSDELKEMKGMFQQNLLLSVSFFLLIVVPSLATFFKLKRQHLFVSK